MVKDIADEVAPLEELLKTTINRAMIALVLIDQKLPDLLPTILEDMFRGMQNILDFCIVDK